MLTTIVSLRALLPHFNNHLFCIVCYSFFELFIFLFPSTAYGQWESLEGPYGGYINELKNNNDYAFAATPDGLFRSNDGENWEVKRFIPDKHIACLQIGILDSLIVADAVDGSVVPYQRHMYISTDNGDSWGEISRPPSELYVEIDINSYGIYAKDILTNKLWVSKDDGTSWKMSHFPPDSAIGYMTSNSKNILLSCHRNIYKSSPDADKWSLVASTPPGTHLDLFYIEDSLLMATDINKHTFLRSIDGGQNWTSQVADYWYDDLPQIVKLGNEYFINLYESLYYSTDAGLTWQTCNSANYPIDFGFVDINGSLLLGSLYQGVFKSIDDGQTFVMSSHGITAANVACLTYHQDTIFTASTYLGVNDYDLVTEHWSSNFMPGIFKTDFNDISYYQGHLYLISAPNNMYEYYLHNWWHESDIYFPTCSDFFFYQDDLLAGGNKNFSGGDLKIKNSSGPSWSYYRFSFAGKEIHPLSMASNDEYLFVSDYHHIYRKHHQLNDWEKMDFDSLIGGQPYQIIMNLYSFHGKIFTVQENDLDRQYRILESDDNGESWIFINVGFPPSSDGITYINSMYSTGAFLLVTTYGEEQGIVASETDNIDWFDFNQGLPSRYINDLTFDGPYMYAAVAHHGVWRRKISDLTLTSYSAIEPERDLVIYPNPATETLYISPPDTPNLSGKILLINLQGQVILQQPFEQGPISLNISTLPSGLYVIKCQIGGVSLSGKVIIQH